MMLKFNEIHVYRNAVKLMVNRRGIRGSNKRCKDVGIMPLDSYEFMNPMPLKLSQQSSDMIRGFV